MFEVDIGPNGKLHKDVRAPVNQVPIDIKLRLLDTLDWWFYKEHRDIIDEKVNEILQHY